MSSEKRKMLTEEDVHTSQCPQSNDHVSAPENCDSLVWYKGRKLEPEVVAYVKALGLASMLSDGPGVVDEDDDIYRPEDVPIKSYVSAKIGCYSDKLPLSTTVEETENHQSSSNEMLTEDDVHTSQCPQSIDHVSAPENCNSLVWYKGRKLEPKFAADMKALGLASMLSDGPGVVDEEDDDIYRPEDVPIKSYVSAKIGCYSDKLPLSTTVEETENHQSSNNEMLTEDDVHTSQCPQSIDHVSAPENCNSLVWYKGRKLEPKFAADMKALGLASMLSDGPGVVDEEDDDIYRPEDVPIRSYVSAKIGCYSDKLPLSTTVEETENHQSSNNEMLTEDDVHTSQCPQSIDHVSAPENCNSLVWYKGRKLEPKFAADMKALGLASMLSDGPGVVDEEDDDIYRPEDVPIRSYVSAKIGCYSDKLPLSTTVEETENHQSSNNEIRQLEAEKQNLERTNVKTAVGSSKTYKRPLRKSYQDIEQENRIIRRKICRIAAQLVDARLEMSRLCSRLSSDLEPDSIAEMDILKAAQLQAERREDSPTGNKFFD